MHRHQPSSQAEHKIQSSGGQLTLDLEQVPKALGVLTGTWAPRAVVVSFKLETDEDLLISKVSRKYALGSCHIVCGNPNA